MKKSFSLIELVIVIVTIGIISVFVVPSFNRYQLQEAVDMIISHINYTKHLAMQDNKFNPFDDEWYKSRWQIIFAKSNYTKQKFTYSIFSDKRGYTRRYTGNPDISELAVNPNDTSKLLSGGFSGILNYNDKKATKQLNLGEYYGITNVEFKNGCKGRSRRISFDYLGRPFMGNTKTQTSPYQLERLIKSTCSIIITQNDKTCTILIEPETGYTYQKDICEK